MKQVKFGNILSVDKGIIAHGCNALGIMGAGLALEVKGKYPACYEVYNSFCRGFKGTDILGACVDFKVSPDLTIVNAITQQNFGRDKRHTSYKAVHTAFEQIAELAFSEAMDVHYPLIGAGLGGGDWAIISDIIDACFEKYPIVNRTLWIYE